MPLGPEAGPLKLSVCDPVKPVVVLPYVSVAVIVSVNWLPALADGVDSRNLLVVLRPLTVKLPELPEPAPSAVRFSSSGRRTA